MTTVKSLVVFQSRFGNTENLAQQIAEGIAQAGGAAAVVDVRRIRPDDLSGCDLLVLGAPTHTFAASRQTTRDDAVRRGAQQAAGLLGVREWLATLDKAFPSATDRPVVAVFDTRVEIVRRHPGSSAKRAARVLRAQGFNLIVPPTSFFVADLKGRPTFGELDRARSWATRLPSLVDNTGPAMASSEGASGRRRRVAVVRESTGPSDPQGNIQGGHPDHEERQCFT